MPHPATKAEILAALESNSRVIVEFFSGIPGARFFGGDPDHWDLAHVLVHLTDSNVLVVRALNSGRLPQHATGRSRTYAEVRDAAAGSVAATSKEKLLTLGRKVALTAGHTQSDIVNAFATSSAELRSAAEAWAEDAMDRHAIAHPLMGPMTVREMLLFFVVHERHHLRSVQERLAADQNRA